VRRRRTGVSAGGLGWVAAVTCTLVLTACGPEEADRADADEAGAGSDTLDIGSIAPGAASSMTDRSPLIDLWAEGTPAFGVFVPGEREPNTEGGRPTVTYTEEIGRELAADDLLDYVFLNLEHGYDIDAVSAIAGGLEGSVVALLVRIPPISEDGPEAALERTAEVLAAGADGVVYPHVRSVEETRMVVDFMEAADADVWSPSNPDGDVIAMVMVEDPGALAEVTEIADVEGYSVLACGIGSLSQALGDPEAGETGTQEVLAHAKRVGRPDMITADADDVEQRIDEGFLGLLMSGPEADEAIRIGRAAAGR
jgi:2-keto-3-deoxy-L-rhamnonate aldolase RhmA